MVVYRMKLTFSPPQHTRTHFSEHFEKCTLEQMCKTRSDSIRHGDGEGAGVSTEGQRGRGEKLTSGVHHIPSPIASSTAVQVRIRICVICSEKPTIFGHSRQLRHRSSGGSSGQRSELYNDNPSRGEGK